MSDWEDLYDILGVDPEASAEEIRSAYIRKARDYHPDMLRGASGEQVRLSEERMKAVNKAYEILRVPERRRRYHVSWAIRHSPPRPEVKGASLVMTDAIPRQRYTSHFIVRNVGGPYARLSIRNPESWVRVTGCQSLSEGAELPMRVDIEVEGKEWGTSYSETIVIDLDGHEARVRVELQTMASPLADMPPVREAGAGTKSQDWTAPYLTAAPVSPRRSSRILLLHSSTEMRELSLYTDIGRLVGAILGICAGLFYTVVFAVDGASMFPMIPLAGVVVGVASGAFSAILLVPVGLLIGVFLGWAVGIAAWMVHSAIGAIGRRI